MAAVAFALLLILFHLIERIPAQRGVLLGIAAGLGFGISDAAIKALSGDLDSGPVGLLSPWSIGAFALILVGAALIPAPVRAGEALEESAAEPQSPSASPARAEPPKRAHQLITRS